ncbi:polyprenyl synthetase family protein, partial [Intestinimonas massiliensis]
GMVGGQALDMAEEGRSLRQQEMERLQALKTGALIAAAAEMGCIAAGGDELERAAVRRYAQKLGLAFQIRDDMLDVVGDEQTLG